MRLRRITTPEPRIELIPLIDVMMFLVAFFVYAFVLIVRIEVVPMQLQRYVSGREATPVPALTISIDLQGMIHLDRQPIEMDQVLPRLQAARAADQRTVIYLALADGSGTIDRAPMLTALWDRLKDAGLEINFVGRPTDAADARGDS
jgi:biopolymer transport protein ExbD